MQRFALTLLLFTSLAARAEHFKVEEFSCTALSAAGTSTFRMADDKMGVNFSSPFYSTNLAGYLLLQTDSNPFPRASLRDEKTGMPFEMFFAPPGVLKDGGTVTLLGMLFLPVNAEAVNPFVLRSFLPFTLPLDLGNPPSFLFRVTAGLIPIAGLTCTAKIAVDKTYSSTSCEAELKRAQEIVSVP